MISVPTPSISPFVRGRTILPMPTTQLPAPGFSARRLNLLFLVGLIVLVAVVARAVDNPGQILRVKFLTLANFELILLFTSVLFVGSLYRALGNVADHLLYWTKYLKSPRLAIVATALILGAMPVKGRTVMVSPVVSEVAKKHRLAVFPTAIVNHLATHTSYLVSPLSASLLLVVSTLQLDFFKFIGYLLPGTLLLVAVVVYYAWRVNHSPPVAPPSRELHLGAALLLTIPMLVLIATLMLAELRKTPYVVAVGAVAFVLLTLVVLKPTRPQVGRAARRTDFQLVGTLGIIMLLSAFTGSLPGVKAWAAGLISSGYTVPTLIVIGYLTGIIIGSSTSMVAAVFPVLAPLLAGSPHIYQIAAVTYAAQYAGYIASPSHVCCHYVAAYFNKPYLQLWVRISMVALLAAFAVAAVAVWRW